MTRSNLTITHGIIASFGLFVLLSTPASAAAPDSYDAVEDIRDHEDEEALDAAAAEDLEADADEEENEAVEDDDRDADDDDRDAQGGGCSVNPRDGATGMTVLALLGLLGVRRRSHNSTAA